MFTFSVLTFGCRLNQADTFACERDLAARGGQQASAEVADVVVVNTCSVTGAADQAARQAIRRISRVNPRARIVATGCYATRKPGDVAGLPGVIRLVPNERKEALGETAWTVSPAASTAHPAAPRSAPFPRPGYRGRTAYPLAVQTGCDERCSYCTIPSTRGRSRSRSRAEILDDVRGLSGAGYKEVIVTGVHLGAYGRDLSPASSLLDLLRGLAAFPGDVTFRVSSLEPMDCTSPVIDLVAASGRFAPHFHLPLQHASDRVLGAMRRPYSLADYRGLVQAIHLALPDAAIGSDVIVGFPGETDRDHEQQAEYLEASGLTHLHVFPYSDRPGTEASALHPKVSAARVKERCDVLRAISRRLNASFLERQVGRVRRGLTIEDGSRVLTDNYLKVAVRPGHARNQRVRVLITAAAPLRGEVVA